MDKHIKDILSHYVKTDKIGEGYYSEKITEYWNCNLSKTITERTERIEYKKGILYIYINSAALKNELFNSREKLKTIINDHLNDQVINAVIIK